MAVWKTSFAFLLILLLLTGGCYMTPVRHLAADVALLQVGQSTKEDVLIYLGEPDQQKTNQAGEEIWIYKEENRTMVEKTPYLGKYFGSPEYRQVVVIFKNGIVVHSNYSSSDKDDLDWAEDFSWQDK